MDGHRRLFLVHVVDLILLEIKLCFFVYAFYYYYYLVIVICFARLLEKPCEGNLSENRWTYCIL